MTRTGHVDGHNGAAADFADARLAAEEAGAVQQRQAAQRVAQHCRDLQDCRDLLEMLGLSSLRPRAARPVHDDPSSPTSPEALSVHRTTEGERK
ncbi:hypothetical protein [Lentzea sp.]|uniref:hypothetical protein n=1 Tax=Lentzea sp. TaxID=56099 RepID=UPI002ED25626